MQKATPSNSPLVRGRIGEFILLSLLTFLTPPLPTFAATVDPTDLQAGDLIRGQSFSAVYYYGEDGLRYVFPNDKTYFTWYNDFDDVRWLSDADLATIQIAGNVTYKPGVKMVKIQSDPSVYAIGAGGTLRAIGSEAIATALYGSNWNQKIDDMPDGFFGNYAIDEEIEFASQYNAAVEQQDALSIDDDKDLRPALELTVDEGGYSQRTVTIDVGRAIRWTNIGGENHSVTEWDRLWGSGTLEPGEHYTRYFRERGTRNYYSRGDDRNTFEGAIIVE